MESKAVKAVFLTLIMLLSGCLGSEESSDEEVIDNTPKQIMAYLTVELSNSDIVVGDIAIINAIVNVDPADSNYYVESDIITPSGIRQVETTSSRVDDGFRIFSCLTNQATG